MLVVREFFTSFFTLFSIPVYENVSFIWALVAFFVFVLILRIF
jgi:hypothetical protein